MEAYVETLIIHTNLPNMPSTATLKELTSFQETYIQTRRLEGRLYHDDLARRFPEVPRTHPYYEEWTAKKKSLEEMNNYITALKPPIRILEIGSGSGWMANALAQNRHVHMVSLDLHEMEKAQSERIYGNRSNLQYKSLNTFLEAPDTEGFDIILFSSSFHYFGDVTDTLVQWMQYLKPTGEIHIKDTLIHKDQDLADRINISTGSYFKQIGVEDMAKYYSNHCWADFEGFNYRNHNRTWVSQLKKTVFNMANYTFPWIIVKK